MRFPSYYYSSALFQIIRETSFTKVHADLIMICGFQAEYEKEEEKLEVDIQKSRNLLTKHQTELNMKHKQMVTIIGV